MRRTKRLLTSLALSATFLLSNFASVLATPSTDKLYEKAFKEVANCKNVYTQQGINGARSAINALRGSKASWAIGEFSKQTDVVQQKLFEEFMGLLFDSNNKPKASVTQQDVNRARDLVNSFATYTGNAPYVQSWSSAVDGYQGMIIKQVVALVEKAEKSKNKDDIAAARNGVMSLLTAVNNTNVINFAKDLEKRVTALDGGVVVTGDLKVHYIDVGQADSILIQQGNNAMLIDAGNNGDGSLVVDYLKKQDISKLDYIIGTHPHEDHIGGLDSVINVFDIGNVIMPKATHTSQTYKDVITAISNKNLKITTPKVGDSYKLGNAEFTILAPNKDNYTELNDYSIVTRLKYGNNSFIFTGDAEALSEGEILAKQLDISADVLKVGHHGSDTSTSQAFLDKVNPKYAVISVGTGNDYGHPTNTILSRLSAKGVSTFRTDKQGTIVATSNGSNITFNNTPTVPDTTTPPDTNNPTPGVDENMIVWRVSATGTVYHDSKDCSNMKSPIQMTLKDARAKNLKPCSKCNPPQ